MNGGRSPFAATVLPDSGQSPFAAAALPDGGHPARHLVVGGAFAARMAAVREICR